MIMTNDDRISAVNSIKVCVCASLGELCWQTYLDNVDWYHYGRLGIPVTKQKLIRQCDLTKSGRIPCTEYFPRMPLQNNRHNLIVCKSLISPRMQRIVMPKRKHNVCSYMCVLTWHLPPAISHWCQKDVVWSIWPKLNCFTILLSYTAFCQLCWTHTRQYQKDARECMEGHILHHIMVVCRLCHPRITFWTLHKPDVCL